MQLAQTFHLGECMCLLMYLWLFFHSQSWRQYKQFGVVPPLWPAIKVFAANSVGCKVENRRYSSCGWQVLQS